MAVCAVVDFQVLSAKLLEAGSSANRCKSNPLGSVPGVPPPLGVTVTSLKPGVTLPDAAGIVAVPVIVVDVMDPTEKGTFEIVTVEPDVKFWPEIVTLIARVPDCFWAPKGGDTVWTVGPAAMKTVAVPELLLRLESHSLAATPAIESPEPTAVAFTVTVAETLPAIEPIGQVTVLQFSEHEPPGAAPETKLTFAGRICVTVPPVPVPLARLTVTV